MGCVFWAVMGVFALLAVFVAFVVALTMLDTGGGSEGAFVAIAITLGLGVVVATTADRLVRLFRRR